MKKFYLFILSLISFNSMISYGQVFGEKSFYLVDSLDVSALDKNDSTLLVEQLKIYHSEKHDTTKAKVLELLVTEMTSSQREKYVWLQVTFLEKIINKQEHRVYRDRLIVAYGFALNEGGLVLRNHGKIEDALAKYDFSLKIAEKYNDKELEASVLNNIGAIYTMQQNHELAMEYFQRGLICAEEIHDTVGMAMAYNSIGGSYIYQGYDSLCLVNMKKALELYEAIDEKGGISLVLANLGAIYRSQGDIQTGIDYIKMALEINEEIGNYVLVASNLSNLGWINYSIGDYNEAERYGLKSLEIGHEFGFVERIKVSADLLSDIYVKQDRGLEALEMYKLYIKMSDSLVNLQTQKASAEQEAKFMYEKQKALDDAESEKILAIEKEEKKRQELFSFAAAGGFILVLGFLVFVFNRLKITRRQKAELDIQKKEIELQKARIEEAHHEIKDSINYAKRIQDAILPPANFIKQNLPDSFVLYKPKDIVAGDFYWMEKAKDELFFAAADCTGHGVPGAMVSVVCHEALNRSVREFGLSDAGKILGKTRDLVIETFEKSEKRTASEEVSGDTIKDGMDIAFCGLKGNTLQFAGAHNPLWIVRNGSADELRNQFPSIAVISKMENSEYCIAEIKADKQPVGKFDNAQPYTTHKIELKKGDTFYIFSDGYADQFGGDKGKKFKSLSLKQLLISIQDKTIHEQEQILNQAFEEWRGSYEQLDDVCIIGVRV